MEKWKISGATIASFTTDENRRTTENWIINLKTRSEIVNRIAYFNDEPTKEIENREYKTTCDICVKLDEFKID